MPRLANWENQIGQRFRLRDLHVLFTVAERGTMAKAAAELGISQPAISDLIADIEQSLGVRLFDRTSQGVQPTVYGHALLRRGLAAFDELKQGMRDIAYLADPTTGELRIGCSESMAAIIPPFLERFSQDYPGVIVHVDNVFPGVISQGAQQLMAPVLSHLRDRKSDLVLARLMPQITKQSLAGDLNVEVLFDDPLVIAVGPRSRWARRRKTELSQLAEANWILPDPHSLNHAGVADAFRAHGLALPKVSVVTFSIPLRIHLLLNGDYVTALPESVAKSYAVKVLPIKLDVRPWAVVTITLKNRTLSPVVERFIECARDVGKSIVAQP